MQPFGCRNSLLDVDPQSLLAVKALIGLSWRLQGIKGGHLEDHRDLQDCTRPGKHTKTMENCPFIDGLTVYLLKMAIFNSYVKLPEGKWFITIVSSSIYRF
jgi:hypothetical protein